MNSVAVSDEIQQNKGDYSGDQDVHLLYFLIVLSRRRKFILLFTAILTILAVIVVLLLPNQYTADTTVLPPGQNSSMSSAMLGQLGGAGALASVAGASLGLKNPGDMYISLFKSRTVESNLIQRFHLMDRYKVKKTSIARAVLESRSKILLGAKDGLITISVTDSDPKMAADIANGWVDEFRKLTANLAISEASQRRAFFQSQLLEAKQNLAGADDAMKAAEQSTGILTIDTQSRSLIESAASLRAQVVAKEVQIESMRTYATENNPEMVTDLHELAALKSQLSRLAGTDQGPDSEFIVPKGKAPSAVMEYTRRLRDVKYFETISDLISKQFELAKLDEARQGNGVQVVDVAVSPDSKSSPKRTLIVAGALFFSFFLSCLWCMIADRINLMSNSDQNREYLATLRATFR